MTFLNPIKVTDGHLNNEEDDEMEEASLPPRHTISKQAHVSKKPSAILLLFPLARTPELN